MVRARRAAQRRSRSSRRPGSGAREGFAEKPAPDAFHYRRDVFFIPGHAWVQRGLTPQAILRAADDALVVSHDTDLVEPAKVEIAVDCRDLRWGSVSTGFVAKSHTIRWHVYPVRGERLALLDGPGGQLVIELVFADKAEVTRIEERDGHVKVRVQARYVTFEGWAAESNLVLPGHGVGAVQSATGTHRTRRPRMKPVMTRIATVRDDTQLWVGDRDLLEAGVLERGAHVRPGEARGDLVAVQIDSGYVTPPNGQRFFVRASALTDHRDEDRNPFWQPPPLPVLDEEQEP